VPEEQQLEVPLDGTTFGAFLALPDAEPGSVPGVVVIHELLGLNDDIRRIARRFAESGYAALAPDLFDGLGPQPICMLRTLLAYRSGGGRALRALEAARDWLAAHAAVDGSRLGVAGFCMGGGFALLLGRRLGVGAAAAFYGDVPPRAEDLEGVCPVVAGYGGRDLVYGGYGRRLEEHLRRLGVPHDVRTYPGAGHSYMSWYGGATALLAPWTPLRAEYDEAAAEDSWTRMLAFFAEHLAPTSPGQP
jgi:carboxymethylenebutenolidase